MPLSNGTRHLVVATVLVMAAAACALLLPMPAHAQAAAAASAAPVEALRQEFGKPLQAAQQSLRDRKFAEALTHIDVAAAIPNPSDYERFIIARLRGAAASGAGNVPASVAAFESIYDNPRLEAGDRLQISRGVAVAAYNAKLYPQAVAWGRRALSQQADDVDIQLLVGQAQYQQQEYPAAATSLQAVVDADLRAGRVPAENLLKLIANSRLQSRDGEGLQRALEALVRHYPTPAHWGSLIDQVRGQTDFSKRLALDTWRLNAATQSLLEAEDHVEMAELALSAGYPAEASRVVERAFAAGMLGSGPKAAAHRELRQRAAAKAAEAARGKLDERDVAAADANGLAAIGMTELSGGNTARGLSLMAQALTKPGLREPEHLRLRLGVARLQAGQKAGAVETLQAVKGEDGAKDLARLWLLVAERS